MAFKQVLYNWDIHIYPAQGITIAFATKLVTPRRKHRSLYKVYVCINDQGVTS